MLHAAAQFNSIRKTLDEDTLNELEKAAKDKKKKLSDVGLDDAPAVYRRLKGNAAKEMPEYRNGFPNPERRVLGGIIVRGSIERDVTINLVALRRLEGTTGEETKALRQYLVSLALIAATADFELYLREGCHLRFAGKDKWHIVPRRGDLKEIDLSLGNAPKIISDYGTVAVQRFKDVFSKVSRDGFNKDWPTQLEKGTHKFDLSTARNLIAAAEAEEAAGGE